DNNTWSNNQYYMADSSGKFSWGSDYNLAGFESHTSGTGSSISQNYPDESSWLAGTPGTGDTGGTGTGAGDTGGAGTGSGDPGTGTGNTGTGTGDTGNGTGSGTGGTGSGTGDTGTGTGTGTGGTDPAPLDLVLRGGRGSDHLTGGDGNDQLYGAAG